MGIVTETHLVYTTPEDSIVTEWWLNFFVFISRLIFEIPHAGGVVTRSLIRTVKLDTSVTAFDYFCSTCKCIFILFIFFYTVQNVLKMRVLKLKYLCSFWNLYDLAILLVSFCTVTGDNPYWIKRVLPWTVSSWYK
jgi:hypothetical protein